ncbi:MAG: hypothetical protein ACR2LT_05440 [Pyrinomonadaceae bacterium]
MTNPKQKLSKNAKAALKILNDSKLLANAKTKNDLKADRNFKPTDAAVKTSAPNKMRPSKKRG